MSGFTPKSPGFIGNAATWLLLGCLVLRGFVPAGFMPAPLALGNPYSLCHGDLFSAQLLNALSPPASPIPHHSHMHHGDEPEPQALPHAHDKAIAEAFSDNHCTYTSITAAPLPAVELLLPGVLPVVPVSPIELPLPSLTVAFLQPPSRAPPQHFLL